MPWSTAIEMSELVAETEELVGMPKLPGAPAGGRAHAEHGARDRAAAELLKKSK
jgi:hypothetical protein